MKILSILFVSLSLLFAGCSEDKPAKVRDNAGFSDMVESQARAIQKAKAIEGVLQEAEKKRREQLGE